MLTLKPGAKGTFHGALERILAYDPLNNAPVRCDQAKLKNVCFDSDPAIYKQALRFWEIAVEGATPAEGENLNIIFKPAYYLEQYRQPSGRQGNAFLCGRGRRLLWRRANQIL
ncbi:hypothetical protein LJC74_04070 [Eubacteriales bacterium OttesenSCG-928-A19]|nr:hypothetical protein [Eubacteriales bacterium OttesenSCG-928-A19]